MTTTMQLTVLTNNLQGAQAKMFCVHDFDLSRSVNITFNVNAVKDIDMDRHKVTLEIELVASWQDTRISCHSCEPAEEVRMLPCS